MRSTGFHHVDLVVSSILRSLPFYRELLEPLGWHRVGEVEGERGETIWYISGPGSSLGLREAQADTDGPFDRYRIGVHHVAFEAPSRFEVDERADWLLARGVPIESGPRSTRTSRATTRSSSTTRTGSSSRSCTFRDTRRGPDDPATLE